MTHVQLQYEFSSYTLFTGNAHDCEVKEVGPVEVEEDTSESSETDSNDSDFSIDSESSDSTSVEVDPSEADELLRDVILYSRNKQGVPLGDKNSVYDNDLTIGPPVITSTVKVSFLRIFKPDLITIQRKPPPDFFRISKHQARHTTYAREN